MDEHKPHFQGVVDLGLRDVGVRTDRRRLAAHFGKAGLAAVALAVTSVLALCVLVTQTSIDAGPWIAGAFVGITVAAMIPLALWMVKRSPPVVVKVSAEGKNQAAWLMIGSFLLVAAHGAVFRDPVLIPVVALSLIMTLVVWRARGQVPAVLRQLRSLLAANESVLGDGVGVMPGARGFRGRQDAWRLIAATDQRLLVTRSTRSPNQFLVVDAPYQDVSRFGIEWKRRGLVGVLSLTAPAADGTSPETHVIGNITPANLLSIARALHAHGVPPDDPAVFEEAERGWEEAQRAWAEGRRPGEQQRSGLIDRSAMSTRQFDRGLWLLLGVSAVILYTSVIGDGLAALGVIGALCGLCGYLSGTRSSLAYVVPLNLLVIPNFFFTGPSDVIALMVLLSVVALAGLWAGSALRRGASAGSPAAPAPGSLRHAISGVRLIRISGVLLAAMLALVVVTSAAGFELTSLRLAVDEATAKQVPVDGRSNLTGNAASVTYTPGPGLREFITDEDWGAGPNDGARWELRSSFTKNQNVVSLAHYIFEPRLDNPAAVAKFVADKDDEHSRMARHRVEHTKRVVDGRTGYVWTHGNRFGYWHYAVWFPHPVHTIRVECIAKQEAERFKRLCDEALDSLEFH
jgi:hypothetical protein